MVANLKQEVPKPWYVNRTDKKGFRETVDEFTSKSEADSMRAEYALGDTEGTYYVSSRCCSDWNKE